MRSRQFKLIMVQIHAVKMHFHGKKNGRARLPGHADLHECHLAAVNIVHGALQSDLILVGHTPQNRAALANARNGQHHIFIGYGLDEFIIL